MRREALDDEQHGLLFDVMRKERYHDRRRAHYEFMHRLTNLFTVLTSGLVLTSFADIALPYWLAALGGVAGVLSATDLIVGYSRSADLHRDLKRRWNSLQQKLCSVFPEQTNISNLEVEKLCIESDEPAIYRALDVMCHNELLVALNYDIKDPQTHHTTLPWYKTYTANFVRWADVTAT